jgi:hypothetical protein
MWMRAAAKTGYVYEMDLYVGKKGTEFEKTDVGLGESVIMQLSKQIEHKNCSLAFDNFFSSVNIMQYLHQKGIKAVATIRPSRKGLFKISEKNLKEGEMQCSITTDGHVSVCFWKDKRMVSVISNFIYPYDNQAVMRRKKGVENKVPVLIPKMVRVYNDIMGGVDLADQRKERYEIDHRSKYRFYLRIFFDLLDISITNSYIIYCKTMVHNERPLTSLAFRQLVATKLIGKFTNRARPTNLHVRPPKRKHSENASLPPAHLPMCVDERRRCQHCSSAKNDCRSNIKCVTCEFHFCLTQKRNCFYEYHCLQ